MGCGILCKKPVIAAMNTISLLFSSIFYITSSLKENRQTVQNDQRIQIPCIWIDVRQRHNRKTTNRASFYYVHFSLNSDEENKSTNQAGNPSSTVTNVAMEMGIVQYLYKCKSLVGYSNMMLESIWPRWHASGSNSRLYSSDQACGPFI